jgi:hypothetical protein
MGITPRNFDGALAMHQAELFVPVTVPATLAAELANDVLHQRNAKEFLALMCLAPGVSIDSAEAALDGQDSSARARASPLGCPPYPTSHWSGAQPRYRSSRGEWPAH